MPQQTGQKCCQKQLISCRPHEQRTKFPAVVRSRQLDPPGGYFTHGISETEAMQAVHIKQFLHVVLKCYAELNSSLWQATFYILVASFKIFGNFWAIFDSVYWHNIYRPNGLEACNTCLPQLPQGQISKPVRKLRLRRFVLRKIKEFARDTSVAQLKPVCPCSLPFRISSVGNFNSVNWKR